LLRSKVDRGILEVDLIQVPRGAKGQAILTAMFDEILPNPIPERAQAGSRGVQVELAGNHLEEFATALRNHPDGSLAVGRDPAPRGRRAMRHAYKETTIYRALAGAGFGAIDQSRTTLSTNRRDRYVLTVLSGADQ
jgi:hypothetical protein